eukprot:432451-Hanusia_phi.AAC.1
MGPGDLTVWHGGPASDPSLPLTVRRTGRPIPESEPESRRRSTVPDRTRPRPGPAELTLNRKPFNGSTGPAGSELNTQSGTLSGKMVSDSEYGLQRAYGD